LGADYSTITDLFKEMATKKVGVKLPNIYLNWAQFEDSCGNRDRAARILKAAIQLKVAPMELQEALLKLESGTKENGLMAKKVSLETPIIRKPLGEKRLDIITPKPIPESTSKAAVITNNDKMGSLKKSQSLECEVVREEGVP
jgi:hypothetical protein